MINKVLNSLPRTLFDTYDLIMERIEDQDEDDVNLAKCVLGWITFAKEPLTVTALQHALATTRHRRPRHD